MIFKRFFEPKTQPAEIFGAKDVTSAQMKAAVMQWYELYYKTNGGKEQSFAQRIAYTVVDAVYRTCFGEYSASLPKDSPKSKVLAQVLVGLEQVRREAFQQALIGGEVFIKPIPKAGGFAFTVLSRPCYVVLGRGIGGQITCVGSCEVSVEKGKKYTLEEKRRLCEDGLLCIELSLFESGSAGGRGRKVPLETLEKYCHLKEKTILPLAVGLGMVHMKTPMANCVDQSFDGVAVFGAAVGKILAAARHEQRTEDEYRLTKPHVIASADIQRMGEDGLLIEIPEYITPIIDDEPAKAGLTVYNPVPNQAALEARSLQHLRDIENIVGLRRGMLAGMEQAERTATEVQASSARWAMTVADFCSMWKTAVDEVLKTCDVLGQMYFGWDLQPTCKAQVSFGDGVLYDGDKEFERLFSMVKEGWLKPEVLAKWMMEKGGGWTEKNDRGER